MNRDPSRALQPSRKGAHRTGYSFSRINGGKTLLKIAKQVARGSRGGFGGSHNNGGGRSRY